MHAAGRLTRPGRRATTWPASTPWADGWIVPASFSGALWPSERTSETWPPPTTICWRCAMSSRTSSTESRPRRTPRRAPQQPDRGGRRLDELAFLHDIAQLATLARDWDELMRSIVDGTTAAMGVEVCSFYLADTGRTRLTLAATNGLDRSQVGRVSLAWGQGITGGVAASRSPIAVED